MDNIWIILLIVGAVISLTQKNTKRRPQTDSDEEEQPRDVLQKHLEEIFGRGEEHPAAPRPTAMPMPAPSGPVVASTPQPPVRKPSAESADTAPVTRPAAQSTASQQQNAEPKKHIRSTAETSARDTSHRNRAMAQATRRQQQQKPSAIQTQQLRKGSAETPAHHSDNELERIIEEFDMERAVIYSEILKPKYEEY